MSLGTILLIILILLLIGGLLAAVPGLEEVDAEVTAEQVAREQSGSLTYTHLLTVFERARSSDAGGFVLVQGTDTLEE